MDNLTIFTIVIALAVVFGLCFVGSNKTKQNDIEKSHQPNAKNPPEAELNGNEE